ncbi:MAG: hypothetical protein LIP08_05950, partial [Bacteroides sp.]|nr:hypothetical protein [Bacteroides sp.]
YKVTDQDKDPADVYPEVPGITYANFALSDEKKSEEERAAALKELYDYESYHKEYFMGYQVNQDLHYKEDLATYLDYHMNNAGDAFIEANCKTNSKFAERAVLDYFASLWNAKWPHQNYENKFSEDWTESYWGYIVSAGCTEANIFALWSARDYLSGQMTYLNGIEQNEAIRRKSRVKRTFNAASATAGSLDTQFTPVAFFSQDAHYSITKAMHVLSIHTFNSKGKEYGSCPLKYPEDYPQNYSEHYLDTDGWPYNVPSNDDGSVYIPALVKLVDFFAEKGHPILINFNYGSTFKGAYDNVESAIKQLVPILKKHNLYERKVVYDKETGDYDMRAGYWFHVDGALGAAYAPFYQMLKEEQTMPVFDFRIKEVTSIAVSGHKWLGSPMPCGIYMTRVRNQMLPPDNPTYIGSPDSTFAGSRNALSPLIMWEYLSKNSYADFIKKVETGLTITGYAVEQLQALQEEIGLDLWVEYTPLTLTVRFRKAAPEVVTKYSLSGEDLYVGDEERSYSHIYIMAHVTKELVDNLIADLRTYGFEKQMQNLSMQINRNIL